MAVILRLLGGRSGIVMWSLLLGPAARSRGCPVGSRVEWKAERESDADWNIFEAGTPKTRPQERDLSRSNSVG